MRYFAIFLLYFVHFSALSCVLRVHVNDFPPYSYKVDDQWQGSRVVLSKRLANKLQCDVEFLELTWARALAMMQSGELDLMFNLTITEERQKFIWFTLPHHHERLVFATTLTEWQHTNSIKSLTQFPGIIAVTQGSFMGHEFMAMLQKPSFIRRVVAVSQRKAKNELVLKDRAQGLIEDYDFLKFAIANYPAYEHLQITPLVLTEQDVSAGLATNSPMYARKDDIELAICELEQQGLWFSAQP